MLRTRSENCMITSATAKHQYHQSYTIINENRNQQYRLTAWVQCSKSIIIASTYENDHHRSRHHHRGRHHHRCFRQQHHPPMRQLRHHLPDIFRISTIEAITGIPISTTKSTFQIHYSIRSSSTVDNSSSSTHQNPHPEAHPATPKP